MPDLIPTLPAAIYSRPRFILWKYAERNGKQTKVPCSLWGEVIDATDDQWWAEYEEAREAAARDGDKIGWVLGNGVGGIDLDDALDANGSPREWAQPIIDRLASKTYCEISPSNRGVKLWVSGTFPSSRAVNFDAKGNRTKPTEKRDHRIEVYNDGRFFTVTEQTWPGSPMTVANIQDDLDWLWQTYLGEPIASPATIDIAPEAHAAADADEALLTKAFSAANGEETRRLYTSSFSVGTRSEAFHSLVHRFVFWTGHDKEQCRRLVYGSELCGLNGGQPYSRADKADFFERSYAKANATVKERYRQQQTPDGDKWLLDSDAVEYSTSDLGNAEFFRDTYADDLRYVPQWKKWLIWDGTRWALDEKNAVAIRAMEAVKHGLPKLGERITDSDKRAKWFRHVANSQARAKIENMMALAGPLMAVTVDELDRNEWLFNCQNGTFDCQNLSLRPHDRGDLITKISSCSYDPSAAAPTWTTFLGRIFRASDGEIRRELLDFVQRAAGYCLTGSAAEQALFILYGIGANGKSTFLNALLWVMGEYGLTSQSSLLLADFHGNGNSEDVATLFGVRAVSCVETREGKAFDEAKVKSLTGGDKIRARRLYENSFEFRPTHKILLATNHKPTVRGNDWGIWRRLMLVPFDQIISEAEKDMLLGEKLRAEADGILAWMIEGLKAWRKNGLEPPAAVRESVNEYRAESDIFGQFLSECCETNPTASVKSSTLFKVYQNWCKDNGIDYQMTSVKMATRLKERGFVKDVRRDGAYWIGISTALISSQADDDRPF